MKILLIGGHGKVAQLITPLLVGRQHEVSAVIRKEEQAETVGLLGAEPVVTDIEQLDLAGFTELMEDHDAVVWSAGAGGGSPARTRAVDQEAAILSMDAAAAAGIRRYVLVSYIGSGIDEVPESNPFHHYARAKAAADEHLRGLDLDWTIVAPGRLTDELGTGEIHLVEEADVEGDVSRADVANVVAEVLEREDTYGRTLRFLGGGEPVAGAVTPHD